MLLRWVRRLLVLGIVASLLAVAVCRVIDPPVTPLAVIRAGQAIVTGRLPGFSRSWRDLDAISPSLVRAVIASEDDAFFAHHGLDIGAIRRARAWNERHPNRPPRGASTITMQTARNVFLWPGRSYVRKALEAWLAVLMEVLWNKRRILEVYLNVIEWGDGVYGAEAAARRYFGVSADDLSPRQAALLAAALPHPLRSDPGAPSRYLRARATVIERRAGRVDLRSLGRAQRAARHGCAERYASSRRENMKTASSSRMPLYAQA
jgi:monofunctional biosynthetic peptidoglycan transglycosylase